MSSARLIVPGCLVCVLAAGQPQVSPSQPESTPLVKPARLEGSVLDDRYSRPLKRAYVVLKPTGAGRSLSGETDESGKFVIENIEPGEYTIEARRDQFINSYLCRRGGIRMPRIFVIRAGTEMLDLTFRLEAWSAIEGKIKFDDGEPAFNVPVLLYRKQYYRGRMVYQQAGAGRSNDRGEYRIAGLMPGAYIIAAIYNKPVKPRNPDDNPNEIPDSEWSYATTYYTSGRSLTDAVPVRLESGQDIPGLDIFLGKVRAVRVRIRITESCTGRVSDAATVQLYRMDESNMPVVPVNADIIMAAGYYSIRGLGPGQYMVVASAQAPPICAGPLRDRRIISVSEYPIDGMELTLTSPRTVLFDLSADSPGFSRSDSSNFAFHLEPRSGLPMPNIPLEKQPSGIRNVYTAVIDGHEEYDLIVDRKPANYYLKSPLRVNDNTRIMMGTKGATVTGSVMTDKKESVSGATVTLIPDPAQDRFQNYMEGYTSEQGIFGANGIAPGKYIVVPWLDVPPCDFFNWENLEACRPFGTSLTLAESEAKGLELVLKPNN